MRRTRLVLADDHGIVVEALGSLLRRDYDVVGTARDGRELVETVRRLRPDVVVADIDMPGVTGLDAVRRLREVEKIDTKVIFLTMHGDPELAAEAFRAGGAGYVLKDAAAEELHTAIQEVLQGRAHVPSRVAKGVLSALATHSSDAAGRLTPRQRDVLRLIAEGHRMKEIAAALDLSTRTVESYKYEMMQALGVGSTAELVRFAIKHGLVSA
jgi:DNA-binding NarL/FixJ family response regulator